MTDQPAPPPPVPWSPEARTWVSLLLFAHLLALVVAVTTYTRPSSLQLRLHELFEPYLRNLHLTPFPVTYPFARYHLTHATPNDTDFSVDVDWRQADGADETLSLPTAMQPGVRYRRYQALADATGMLVSGESGDAYATILPKAIAGSVLKGAGVTSGVLRIRGHQLPDIEEMNNVEAVARAARAVSNVYEAQVIVGPAGVELLRKSNTLEIAPVENRRRRPSPTGKSPSPDAGRATP